MNSNWSYGLETHNSCRNWQYFVPCDLEIWWMTLENNRAPLIYHIKLCAPFQIHRWSQTWVTVQKCQIRVKIGDILSRVTLKFYGWPWETIGHLFYTTLSFVHHFKAMGEFKPDYSSGQNQQFFVLRDLQIWRMTLKNNRAPLLSCFKFCASFHSHQWIQTRVTVRKRPIWVKINVFCTVCPWNLTDDLEKQ